MELHNNPTGSGLVIEAEARVVRDVPEYQPGAIEVNEGELIPKVDSIDVKALLASQGQ